jgi:hypothetical protein
VCLNKSGKVSLGLSIVTTAVLALPVVKIVVPYVPTSPSSLLLTAGALLGLVIAVPLIASFYYATFVVVKFLLMAAVNLVLALIHTAALELSLLGAYAANEYSGQLSIMLPCLVVVLALLAVAGWAAKKYHHRMKHAVPGAAYLLVALLIYKGIENIALHAHRP